MKQGRILLISYYFPPANNARAVRWGALAREFAAQGREIDIITSGAKPSPDAFPPSVRIFSTGSGLAEKANRAPGALRRILKAIHHLTWKRIVWPDYAGQWYAPAARMAKRLCSQNEYDSIISVGLPFTAHLVGFCAARRNPKARWLADMGDPFSFNPVPLNNTLLYGGLNRRTEKKVFSRAASVPVTTEETARRYRAIHPEISDKFAVIPPMLSVPERLPEKSVCSGDGAVNVLLAATFYRGIRNPAFILEVLSSLEHNNLKVHIAGNSNDCAEIISAAVGESHGRLIFHGPLERGALFAAMREADFIVNIGNEECCQLPSKVVEYLWAGTPVINVAPENDSSSAFMSGKLDFIHIIPALGSQKAAQDISGFLSRARGAKTPSPAADDYLPRNIARAYEKALSGDEA